MRGQDENMKFKTISRFAAICFHFINPLALLNFPAASVDALADWISQRDSLHMVPKKSSQQTNNVDMDSQPECSWQHQFPISLHNFMSVRGDKHDPAAILSAVAGGWWNPAGGPAITVQSTCQSECIAAFACLNIKKALACKQDNFRIKLTATETALWLKLFGN